MNAEPDVCSSLTLMEGFQQLVLDTDECDLPDPSSFFLKVRSVAYIDPHACLLTYLIYWPGVSIVSLHPIKNGKQDQPNCLLPLPSDSSTACRLLPQKQTSVSSWR